MKGCFVVNDNDMDNLFYFYGNGRMEQIRLLHDICDKIITEKNLESNRKFLKECKVIFCTWGMFLNEEQLKEYFPKLEIVLYASHHSPAVDMLMNNGVRVVNARKAMAIPVAQFAASMIFLANKGVLLSMDIYKREGYEAARIFASRTFPGTYFTKIGILGAGAIGSYVIKLLEPNRTEILVYDPFLSDDKANELQVRKASLEEIFSQCQTISNHLANKPETVGLLNYNLFSIMKDNATFINTGRGPQVVEEDLIRALTEKPCRSAILDVTELEPIPKEHPFLSMTNVYLTPHIAGFAANETSMFADLVIEESRRFINDLPLQHEVTPDMLEYLSRG